MDENLKNYLEDKKISYKLHKHKPVFTVEESKLNLDVQSLPGIKSKNLFIKDDKSNFYLVCMKSDKKLDTKYLRNTLMVKKVKFASPEELKEKLNLTPGSVSIFGMIYSKDVELILDESIWKSDYACFHPNINTGTIVIDHHNLEIFYNTLNCKKRILNL